MPTYTTDANLTAELPQNLPSTVDSTYRAVQITRASAMVDALVGDRFALSYESSVQRFPNAASSPATPAVIEQCATYLAAAFCFVKLGETIRFNSETGPQNGMAAIYREMVYNERATGLADLIRKGTIVVTLSDGTILGRASRRIASPDKDTDPAISLGRYDENGNLLDSVVGSLDDF